MAIDGEHGTHLAFRLRGPRQPDVGAAVRQGLQREFFQRVATGRDLDAAEDFRVERAARGLLAAHHQGEQLFAGGALPGQRFGRGGRAETHGPRSFGGLAVVCEQQRGQREQSKLFHGAHLLSAGQRW